MSTYIKRFTNVRPKDVKREAELLNIAASYGLAPDVIDTDYKTYIEMNDLSAMNVADMWGDEIPEEILGGMFSIIWILYHVCNIEYRDIWPRNFIVVDKRVYIVDFGHARRKQKKCNKYLLQILNAGTLTHWNPEFR